jgi:general nucleoside transport system ATP-binding protein
VTTTVLRLAGITKRFGEVLANDGVGLELAAGEIVGLLGENGAGKTTLMSVLFGHYVADAGTIEVAGADGALRPLTPGSPRAALEAGIGMVHQHFTLADNLSALDNIALGTEPLLRPVSRRAEARRALGDLMGRSGLRVDLDAPVRSLSVGERQRVEILKVLHRRARILILDEPTAVLTPQEADELFAVLRGLAARGLAVVLISHKLAEILALTHRVVVLRAGRAVADLPTAAATREDLAELMVGRPVPPAVREPLAPGRPVLELLGVEVADARGRALLRDASLTVREREIVGVAGVAGNGQAGLAGLLAGTHRARRGEVRLLGEDARAWGPADLVARGVARVPEDRHRDGVVGTLSLWENLALPDRRRPEFQRLGWLRRAAARARTREAMAAYDVRAPGPDAPVRLLSGGNIQKLILARELGRRPALILADQPTRGLDVGAVAEVHRRLLDARGRGAAVLLISEDLDELLALADRIAVVHRGRLGDAGPAERLTPRALGLMMGGHEAGAAAAAAAEGERARAA